MKPDKPMSEQPSVFEDSKYKFCHDPEFKLKPEEQHLCKSAVDVKAKCPAFKAACDGMAADKPSEPWTIPPWLATGTMYVVTALLVAGALYLIYQIIRRIKREESELESAELAAVEVGSFEGDEPSDAAPARPRVVEKDVARLLELAQRHLANGQHDDAIAKAYAAVLRQLERQGLIAVEEEKTNGEYLAELIPHQGLATDMRPLVRDVEVVQFGNRVPDAAMAGPFVQRATALVHRVVAVAAMFAIFALAGCGSGNRPGSGMDLFGNSNRPGGRGAVYELWEREGAPVSRYHGAYEDLSAEQRTLFVLPDGAPHEEAEWDQIDSWVRADGGRLILAGVIPPKRLLDVAERTHSDAELREVSPTRRQPLTVRVPDHAAVRLGPDAWGTIPWLVREQEPYAVKRRLGKGEIIYFVTPALFVNANVALAENEEFIADLAQRTVPIAVCDRSRNSGASNPFQSVARAHLTPLVIQLGLLLLLYGLYRGRAFGKPKNTESDLHRRSFADHIKAMGRRYFDADGGEWVSRHYARWMVERFREREALGNRASLVEVAERLAPQAGMSEDALTTLLARAMIAPDESRDSAGALKLVRDLERIWLRLERPALVRAAERGPTSMPPPSLTTPPVSTEIE